MRGTPLASLVNMLKAEIATSQTVGTAGDLEYQTLLSNKQQWLATEYDWPFLEQYTNVLPNSGQRYAVLPNLNLERPLKVEVKWSSKWQEVMYGVGSEEYNYSDSDIGTQIDPIQRWRTAGQIEIAIPVAPTLASVAGTLTGTFKYAVTFLTANGETSIGASAAITLTTQKTNLTAIPVGAAASIEGVNFAVVTSRNIYRTKAGGSIFYLIGSIADNITTTFADNNTADALLVTPSPTYSTAEVTAFELWPLPASSNQQIRFTGQRMLQPLIALTDTADLDDQMLVLFTAAEKLLWLKQANAQVKLQAAQARMTKVRSAYPRRTQTVIVGGGVDRGYNKIVPIKVIATA